VLTELGNDSEALQERTGATLFDLGPALSADVCVRAPIRTWQQYSHVGQALFDRKPGNGRPAASPHRVLMAVDGSKSSTDSAANGESPKGLTPICCSVTSGLIRRRSRTGGLDPCAHLVRPMP
jgi:hypothetical protein